MSELEEIKEKQVERFLDLMNNPPETDESIEDLDITEILIKFGFHPNLALALAHFLKMFKMASDVIERVKEKDEDLNIPVEKLNKLSPGIYKTVRTCFEDLSGIDKLPFTTYMLVGGWLDIYYQYRDQKIEELKFSEVIDEPPKFEDGEKEA